MSERTLVSKNIAGQFWNSVVELFWGIGEGEQIKS